MQKCSWHRLCSVCVTDVSSSVVLWCIRACGVVCVGGWGEKKHLWLQVLAQDFDSVECGVHVWLRIGTFLLFAFFGQIYS